MQTPPVLVSDHDESKDGPLPGLLLGMTLVTGLVDAFSYLTLGHIFVANMTGNIVFLAFALAGASGFSIINSLLSLGSFVVGAFVGGFLGTRLHSNRGHLLSSCATLQSVFMIGCVALAAMLGNGITGGYLYALIAALAVAMGLQNATARKLAVPDLTTTVLTLTITGLATDSRIVGGKSPRVSPRLLSVAAMFLGALIGALMILNVSAVYPLIAAFGVIVIIAIAARALSRTNESWVHPTS